MLSANNPALISSYELVARSLEDSIKYDNLSDAEKSRARKKSYVKRRRNLTLWQRCLASIKAIDMFWALTVASVGTFVLIALSLLYFRHSYQVFLHRFSHEELSLRRQHLGFDHIYVVERPAERAVSNGLWEEASRRLEIKVERWPVSVPTPVDPLQTMIFQRECWRPHKGIYRDMEERGFMDALIIEDHVVAGSSPQLRLYSALMAIPGDWDVLQLGPPANGTDSGHHDDIPIHWTGSHPLAFRRVDDGACNNLAYAISRAGARKLLRIAETTHAHADFEHKMMEELSKAKFLVFRVSPNIFTWQQQQQQQQSPKPGQDRTKESVPEGGNNGP
ncbi:hypothetical protein LPJ64_002081 [Coemansia asiatica]|uniref:Uncharacterized protein n=1 Tax=Coemansia asiatica TaxID=1052880 RepID=A0A9W7XMT8_9FUNG|nr:hypothetical protein LPJ64_002081 [Coemansia asiatica]KAJ2888593.1 hypothetical protein FB639_000537 [Coemansia asiatica]